MFRPTLRAIALSCLVLPLAAQSSPLITTRAGTGTFGTGGDGAAAVLAELASPADVAVDAAGNVYFVDDPGYVTGESARIRRIDAATGVITTVAGGGALAYPNDGALAVDAEIWCYEAVAVDAAGNLYFDDYPVDQQLLRRVDAVTGRLSTIAGGQAPTDFVSYRTLNTNGSLEYRYPSPAGIGDGGPATNAYLYWVRDLAFDAAGDLYVADWTRVRRIDAASQVISTVAGTGEEHVLYIGPVATSGREWVPSGVGTGDGAEATSTGFTAVAGIAFDASGNLYVAERGQQQGFVGPLVGLTGPLDVVDTGTGLVLVERGTQAVLAGVTADSTFLVGWTTPWLNPALYQAEVIDVSRVRRIDAATGIVSTVAGTTDRLAWTSTASGGYFGDGGPAAAALLAGLGGIALDAAGNLFLADETSRVLRVDAATQLISTLAGGASAGYGGDGGPAAAALLARPVSVAFDAAGDLVVADFDNFRLRAVSGLASNAPPTADAGPDQALHAGGVVQLDGSGSYDDDTPTASLAYAWTLTQRPPGSAAALIGAGSASPAFVADLPGTYVAELIVTDGQGLASAPDSVEVASTNLAPTAHAGLDVAGYVGQLVTLDGTASDDPESDPLGYLWVLSAAPASSLAALIDDTSASPSLVPDLPGTYVVALLVDDGFALSPADEVVVTVVTGQEFAAVVVVDAIADLAALPATSVTTAGNQETLVRFLSQAAQAIDSGNVAQARQRLEKALDRTDGCVLRGAPDMGGPSRDWVTDCAAQAALYDELTLALAALAP